MYTAGKRKKIETQSDEKGRMRRKDNKLKRLFSSFLFFSCIGFSDLDLDPVTALRERKGWVFANAYGSY